MAQPTSTARMQLICATLGKAGAFYTVDVPASDTIDNVKERIHAKLFPSTAAVRAPDLTLYIARDHVGFIPYGDDASQQLREFGVVPPRVEAMVSRGPLVEVDTVAEVFGPAALLPSRSIHVFVRVPTVSRKHLLLEPLFAPGPAKRARHADPNGQEKDVEFFEMRKFPPMANRATNYKRVLIREAYKSIYDRLSDKIRAKHTGEDVQHLVVTGNPGVGKSRFYLYVIWRLTTIDYDAFRPLILVINYKKKYWRFVAACHQFRRLTSDQVEELQEDVNVVRLIESESDDMDGSWTGVSVLFSSPGGAGLKKFRKCSLDFIMPPWSIEELQAYNSILGVHWQPSSVQSQSSDDSQVSSVNSQRSEDSLDAVNAASTQEAELLHDSPPAHALQLSPDKLKQRFEQFGGIPRFVFTSEDSAQQYQEAIDAALLSYDVLQILQTGMDQYAKDPTHYSHRLLVMVPNAPGESPRSHLEFASNAIAAAVIKKADDTAFRKLSEFSLLHKGSSPTGGLRGHIHEHLGHRFFELFKNCELLLTQRPPSSTTATTPSNTTPRRSTRRRGNAAQQAQATVTPPVMETTIKLVETEVVVFSDLSRVSLKSDRSTTVYYRPKS